MARKKDQLGAEPTITFNTGGSYDKDTPKGERDSMWQRFWAQLDPENRGKQVSYSELVTKVFTGKPEKKKKKKNKKKRKYSGGRGNR